MRERATSWFDSNWPSKFVETKLSPGEFHPRIARASDAAPLDTGGFVPTSEEERHLIATARAQLTSLVRHLEDICRTVHPAPANFAAFGHEIRSLIMLACTEVESQWRGVLAANGLIKGKYSTLDYVRLAGPMRLPDFEIGFSDYPWLGPIRPFAGWGTTGKPSQELHWYNAYNQTKHDREGKLSEATLEHAIHSTAACVAMLCAQFGTHDALGFGELRATVYPVSLPSWDPSEVYISPYDTTGWKPVPYPFFP